MDSSVGQAGAAADTDRTAQMKAVLFASALLLLPSLLIAGEPPQSFRVATYNLNWGNRRGDQILDAIVTSKADVVFLQETTPQSERFLQRRLRNIYPHFRSIGHDGRYAAERFAFASRVALRDVVFHPPANGLFGFFTATCRIGGEPVRLINVHLSPFVLRRGSGITGMMAALYRTEKQHHAEIEAICRGLDPTLPTIVAGDFNSISTFTAPTHLASLGFTDSFAAIHKDADTHATWQWPTRPLPLKLRIDYIFHTRHFRTVRSEILQRRGSDHFLVVSELRFAGQSRAR